MAGRPPSLTAAAVRYLRQWRAERLRSGKRVGPPVKRLCHRYGISDAALWQVASGETYRWVQ